MAMPIKGVEIDIQRLFDKQYNYTLLQRNVRVLYLTHAGVVWWSYLQ